MNAFVLAGTPKQFENFNHAFGPGFTEIWSMDQLRGTRRVLVLLVGTWHQNPLYNEVLQYCQMLDTDHRPHGQAFAMMGRPGR